MGSLMGMNYAGGDASMPAAPAVSGGAGATGYDSSADEGYGTTLANALQSSGGKQQQMIQSTPPPQSPQFATAPVPPQQIQNYLYQ